MPPLGHTRSSIARNHALIAPDSHVASPLVGWVNATGIVHISPGLGARFAQYTALLDSKARSGPPGAGVERFLYVAEGQATLSIQTEHLLKAGGYAFVPADTAHEVLTTNSESARLVVFEKVYQPWSGGGSPEVVVGQVGEIGSEPYRGDADAQLQTMLPEVAEFDMAVNLFTYQSGARLPQVEVHVMEHGLLMLDGEGVYRLGDSWYPVQAGDVIWMAAYCPQWFVAMGKTPARYIYYKDIHRNRLTD